MIVIDGKQTAKTVRAEIKAEVEAYERVTGGKVGLAVVLAGNDAASKIYVNNKIKACEEVGIRSFAHYLPEDVSQKQLLNFIDALAQDENVHGILVQLPLPSHIDERAVLAAIPNEKDVDGFGAFQIGRLALGEESTVACTPLGIMELLRRYNVDLAGKRAVVVGRSRIVGRPMALLLLNADATVTVCHSRTVNLKDECLRADILIAAVGKAKFITADMVKEGAVVVDVGMNRDENGQLCGDVDFEAVKEKVSYITPVPGGVGPMTIAMLLKNTVEIAKRKNV